MLVVCMENRLHDALMHEQLAGLTDVGATWVLWVLVALSIGAVAVVFERGLFFFRTRDPEGAVGDEWEVDRARQLAARPRSFEGQVLAAGFAAEGQGRQAVERRMVGAARRLQREASKRLTFLGTVGSNAPFVGLLGTVIGIVRAFQELDASRGQVTAGLMSEVGEALVATAVGILVALPAVFFYNFFQQLVQARLDRAEASAQELLARIGE